MRTTLIIPLLVLGLLARPVTAGAQATDNRALKEELRRLRDGAGWLGPTWALADAVPEHDAAWMQAHLRNPQALVPGSAMPAIGLLDDEIAGLVAYIEELRGGGPYSDQAPRMSRRYCSECHRLGGRGGDKGSDLSAIGGARAREFLHRYIENPKLLIKQSKMPGFLAPEGALAHAQIEDIARFLAAQQGSTVSAD